MDQSSPNNVPCISNQSTSLPTPTPTPTPSKTYNYALYGILQDSVKEHIQKFIDHVKDRYESHLVQTPSEDPHLTILYGPALALGETEITDAKEVYKIYPNMQLKSPYVLHYRGVSHFQRKNKFIIKMEFLCEDLTELHIALRKQLPEVDEKYTTAHKSDGDDTRAAHPKRWLHVTLATVTLPADTWKDHLWPVVDMEEMARIYFEDFPPQILLKGLACMSAVSDTCIMLENACT